MKAIKKGLCTALAALTIVSVSSAVNYAATGQYFSNSIVASAQDEITYYSGLKVTYSKNMATFNYKNNKTVYNVHYYSKCTDKYEQSIVHALSIKGINSSFDNRAKIAETNGIVKKASDYKGTYKQNVSMLMLMKEGHLISDKTKQ